MENLGYKTDFIFFEEKGIITKLPEYYVVQSPNNPTFFFGNYLLLNQAPKANERKALEAKFDKAFANMQEVKHYTFCWGASGNNDFSDFTAAGYQHEELSVLVLNKEELIEPSRLNTSIHIRPLESEADWEQWQALEIEEREEGLSLKNFMPYIERKKRGYQILVKKNRGHFYGAFIDEELVAAAGLFHKDTTGRFQQVCTKKSFRRQGICTTLIYEISKQGFQTLENLVIVADKNYHALGIYQRLGFLERFEQESLCLWAS